MNESVAKLIKKNKITNNALLDIYIYDVKEFTYEKKKYVIIYLYSEGEYSSVEINNKKPIYESILITVAARTARPNTFFVCYEKDDVKDGMKITSYTLDLKTRDYSKHKVNEYEALNYDIFESDDNHLNMITYLNEIENENISFLPKKFEKYYLCVCGEINPIDGKACKKCGIKKQLIEKLSTIEGVEKAYVTQKFKEYKFNSKNKEDEFDNFKGELFDKDSEYKINKKNIPDEFIEELFKDSSHKIKDYDNRKKRNKIILAICIAIILIIIGVIIGSAINSENIRVNFIAKYCDESNYKKIYNVNDLLDNATCPNIVNYLYNKKNMGIPKDDIEELIESNNKTIYEIYNKVMGEELYISLNVDPYKDNYNITNKEYIRYLGDNDVEVEPKWVNKTMSNSIKNDDKELFELTSRLYKNSNMIGASGIFTPSDKSAEELTKLSSYSLIYHQNTKNKDCYLSDLYSIENINYLNQFNENACSSNMICHDSKTLDNFIKSGGTIKKCDLIGMFNYWNFTKFKQEEYNSFEKLLKLYKKSKCNINEKVGRETPLDIFLDKKAGSSYNYIICEFSKDLNMYKKECNSLKKYYKLLKKYGAKCSYNCDDEKYFK
ncbi:MAG: hypothetical protein IKR57_02745 [Bacilli bacterium]|nr:hypothetical protein [Bacilli bacterium]